MKVSVITIGRSLAKRAVNKSCPMPFTLNTFSVMIAPPKTQRYAIPANINIEDYESVAIWCQEFNVTFGYADI